MNQKVKKFIATGLISGILMNATSINVFASENNLANIERLSYQENTTNEENFEKLPEITQADWDAAIKIALEMEVSKYYEEVKDVEATEVFRADLTKIVQNPGTYVIVDPTDGAGGAVLTQPADSWVPNINLENKYVSAATNTIVNATLIAAGAGSVALFLKQYGAYQARKIFTATISSKILGKAALAAGGSVALIVDFIFNLANPGDAVAKWLDSIDHIPNNGSFNVIW